MAIKVRLYTVTVGSAQRLTQAQGEDCEYRLTFQDPAGTPVDLTGAQSIVLTVKDRNGLLLFSRNYSGFIGAATAGTPYFRLLQADTVNRAVQPYDLDVTWTDASGYREQLLVLSEFSVVEGVGQATDAMTSTPPVPMSLALLFGTGLPSPSSTYRGFIFTVFASTNNPDATYICLKLSDNSYGWFELSAAP